MSGKWPVFLISSYGAPLAQWAYLALHSSLFGPVVQLIIIQLSLTASLIGSRCIPNGTHTNHCWANLAHNSKFIKNSENCQLLDVILSTILVKLYSLGALVARWLKTWPVNRKVEGLNPTSCRYFYAHEYTQLYPQNEEVIDNHSFAGCKAIGNIGTCAIPSSSLATIDKTFEKNSLN